MALTTSAGSGSITNQANTQSPQTSAGSGSPAGAPAKSVQPGTATTLLADPVGGSSGIPLTSTALTVVNINTSAQTETVSQPTQPAAKPKQHHMNPVLLAIVIIFLVLAVILFWWAARSAKNTTKY